MPQSSYTTIYDINEELCHEEASSHQCIDLHLVNLGGDLGTPSKERFALAS
jgi:hypothetical protein